METRKLIKEIKGVFKPPIKKYSFGKAFGYPYFLPINYNETIISIRKLIKRTDEEYEKYVLNYPYSEGKEEIKFKNLPMVRRSKDWIIKVFNNYYFIQIGFPIMIKNVELGWKDKWESPRVEWSPAFIIYFFKWKFAINWVAPESKYCDLYYEMILWYLFYSDKDIIKAEKTWPWLKVEDGIKKSTWDNKYLIND